MKGLPEAIPFGQYRYATLDRVAGFTKYQKEIDPVSAPELFEHFGFTTENVVAVCKDVMGQ